jgi:hypothetical protein
MVKRVAGQMAWIAANQSRESGIPSFSVLRQLVWPAAGLPIRPARARQPGNRSVPTVHSEGQQTGLRRMTFDNMSLIDDARTVCLCDVGGAGYVAATCARLLNGSSSVSA